MAPSERAMLEAFFLWIYTARAHNDGTVDMIIEEALAYPHPQSPQGLQGAAGAVPDPRHHRPPGPDRRPDTGGGRGPRHHHAGAIRAHRRREHPWTEFVLLPEEAHQPFQEVPEEFNALVEGFWRRVDAGG